MITRTELTNFGPLAKFKWENLGHINLVIGDNGSGKTFLLKALYSAVRTLEEYKRGNAPRGLAEILVDKLYWTFQADKIGDLVRKGASESLKLICDVDEKEFCYSFGKDTTKQISSLENHVPPRDSNSVFLPAKEVLSLYHIIFDSREKDMLYGFDDTYYDLVKAIRTPPQRGKNYPEFAQGREDLETILGGKIEYDEAAKRWIFRKGNFRFPMGITAEGIKKIAILDRLLCNRHLNSKSIVFMDEPDVNLHPAALSKLLDIVANLAEWGIQFFIASHSYFVVKKLELVARKKKLSVPTIIHRDGIWYSADLKEDEPDNPIIDESVRLYEQALDISFQ